MSNGDIDRTVNSCVSKQYKDYSPNRSCNELEWSFKVFFLHSSDTDSVPCSSKPFPMTCLSFHSSSSIPPSVKSLTPFLFWSFPLLVGAVKQKPAGPEGQTPRRVILPLTDNTNSRLQIIMFDWALVGETLLLTLIIFRYTYILLLSDKPHICV